MGTAPKMGLVPLFFTNQWLTVKVDKVASVALLHHNGQKVLIAMHRQSSVEYLLL